MTSKKLLVRPPVKTTLWGMVNGSPLRGAPPLGGEGWAQEHGHPLSHPSVTFGDSSPRRGATLYTRYLGCRRGEHCSPAESYAAAKLPGRTLFAPTPTKIWPRRGQCGKRKKSVKKNAALLHFLGFFSLTHLFGVPRGEQPLGRGPLPRNSGTFFVSFFGHKKGKPCGRSPLKRGGRRRVAASGHLQPQSKIKPLL